VPISWFGSNFLVVSPSTFCWLAIILLGYESVLTAKRFNSGEDHLYRPPVIADQFGMLAEPQKLQETDWDRSDSSRLRLLTQSLA
jgi:hypothetical protein